MWPARVYDSIAAFSPKAASRKLVGQFLWWIARMNDNSDDGDIRKAGLSVRDGYRSPRKPKLRTAVSQRPPRLPEPCEGCESDEFGAAAEDGLRMLAALETMPSLEPEFGDDPTAEAAVTIVERSGTRSRSLDGNSAPAQPNSRRSLTERLGDVTCPFDSESEHDLALLSPIEEATVEIIEVRRGGSESHTASLVDEPSPRTGPKLPRRA